MRGAVLYFRRKLSKVDSIEKGTFPGKLGRELDMVRRRFL
jgi:hypothetical protein